MRERRLRRKSDEKGQRANEAFFHKYTALLICLMYLFIDVLWKKKTLERKSNGKSKKKNRVFFLKHGWLVQRGY